MKNTPGIKNNSPASLNIFFLLFVKYLLNSWEFTNFLLNNKYYVGFNSTDL